MALWPAVFIAPLAFLAELALAYALVPYACEYQRHGPLHALAGATLAVAIGAALYGWRVYRASGSAPVWDGADEAARDRFVGLLGVMVSAITALALIGQWIMMFAMPPCVR